MHSSEITSTIDKKLFEEARQKMTGLEKGLHGIGTLQEKTIHSVLKYYYAPNPVYHEQKIASYVADICVDGEIFEIQTRNFNTMRGKLNTFLPDYDVTIIYPIAATKWIQWIDMDTGELSPKRKSPKKGTVYQIIPELYRIRMFLNHPNLHFILSFLEVEEHKYLNGWSRDKKHGATRADGFPVDIQKEIYISSIEDYRVFIPQNLPEHFSSKDFSKTARIPLHYAQKTLLLLHDFKLVERIDKKGNLYIYKQAGQ